MRDHTTWGPVMLVVMLNLARLTSFIQTNIFIIYADFCENNNEPSVSIKGAREFLGKLNNY
jgi:hypothetical protein